ncbi:3-phytase A [Talaromyces atroroseus]|uniref:Phytase A n=1 Tax=Talaromyces atroroseus TaxID=1441469 RepID=A0A225ANU2_TALAT|nr:3-phytase A [Talaromyces atroroseus]OKL62560.1 3-phytase A [Talaromyces atroroseus]
MAVLSRLLLSASVAALGVSASPLSRRDTTCSSVDEGYTCFPDIAQNWGMYAPYFSLEADSSISPDVPTGCEITLVQALTRHGARYPTSGKNAHYQALIEAIQTNVTHLEGQYAFLKTYNYSFGAGTLTPFGELELYQSGIKFYNRYESLARDNVPFVRSSSSERVVDSSEQFNAGFQATKNADTLSNKTQSAPVINVILEESSTFNNTLDPSICTNFENSDLADDVQATFAGVFVPKILKRVQAHLHGITLTTKDVIYLMDMCPFDTIARTSDGSELSPFCELFTKSEWEQYNYYQSLGKYYGYGSGNPLGPAQGIGFTNELIARLTGTPVQDDTSTNHTLDSSPVTFPLNQALYADFSHDNGMEPIFAAMGLFNGTKPLSETRVESLEETSDFSAAWSVPFAARMYVEMMTCHNDSNEPLVRVLVNDRVISLYGCEVDSLGRCTRDDFVQGLSFARSGGNWASCFH